MWPIGTFRFCWNSPFPSFWVSLLPIFQCLCALELGRPKYYKREFSTIHPLPSFFLRKKEKNKKKKKFLKEEEEEEKEIVGGALPSDTTKFFNGTENFIYLSWLGCCTGPVVKYKRTQSFRDTQRRKNLKRTRFFFFFCHHEM